MLEVLLENHVFFVYGVRYFVSGLRCNCNRTSLFRSSLLLALLISIEVEFGMYSRRTDLA